MSGRDQHLVYQELLGLYALGALEGEDRIAMERHLATGCDQCRVELDAYARVSDDLLFVSPPIDAVPPLSSAIFERVTPEATATSATERLIGRERELNKLSTWLADPSRGKGALIRLVGEAGIGKTRLLAEALDELTSKRTRIFSVRSEPDSETLRYFPVAQLIRDWMGEYADPTVGDDADALRSTVDDLGIENSDELFACLAVVARIDARRGRMESIWGLTGDALQRLVHGSVHRFIEALVCQGPLVLAFDDVHWMDTSSVQVIEGLLPLVESRPIAFVLASRPCGESAPNGLLQATTDRYQLFQHELRLGPLEGPAENALVREFLGVGEFPEALAEQVRSRAEGNPLYTRELVRSLRDAGMVRTGNADGFDRSVDLRAVDVPTSLAETVLRRADHLSASARRLVNVAAVAGRDVYARALAQLEANGEADLDAALQELLERGFLEPIESRETASLRRINFRPERVYRFHHALVREALYEAISPDERTALHGRYASAMETTFADRLQDFYPTLAYHFTRANDATQAVAYLELAGTQAAESAATAEALHLFREAHRLYRTEHSESGGDTQTLARLELNLSTALVNAGHLEESVEHSNAMLRHSGRWVPDSRLGLVAKLCWDLPQVLWHLYVRPLRTHGGDNVSDVLQVMYSRCRAQNIIDTSRNVFDNIDAIHYQLRHRDEPDSDYAAAFASAAGTFFSFSGLSFGIAERLLTIGGSLAGGDEDPNRVAYESMSFVNRYLRGDWDPTKDMSADVYATGLRHGRVWDLDVYLGLCCERNIRQGRFDEAEDQIQQLCELQEDWGYGFAASNVAAQTVYLALERRQLDDALAGVIDWYDTRQEATLHLVALATRAKIEALQGHLDLAEKSLSGADSILSRNPMTVPFHAASYWSAALRVTVAKIEATVRDGKPIDSSLKEQFERHRRKSSSLCRRVARDRTEVGALVGRGQALLGQSHSAQASWRQAIDTGKALSCEPELARLYRDIAGYAVANNMPTICGETTDGLMVKARESFERLGLTVELESLDDFEARWKVA